MLVCIMKPKASSQRLPDYPLNVIFDRSVSQPAVDWPTPGLVHNTSSLIALVSLQGASAYTTSGRWPPGLRFDSGCADCDPPFQYTPARCYSLVGGFGIFSPLAPGDCWGLLLCLAINILWSNCG